MPTRAYSLLLAALLTCLGPVGLAAGQDDGPKPVRFYVGPLVQDGIIETDSGVEDTIKDVKGKLRWRNKDLVVVATQAEAQVSLIILGRNIGRNMGAVAIPLAGSAIALPIEGKAVAAQLQVGTYTRPLACEEDSWGDCAGSLLDDVRVWIKANRSVIKN